MAKRTLVSQDVEVEPKPHEFEGKQYVTVTVKNAYDDGAVFVNRHNIPAGLCKKVAAGLAKAVS